MVPIVLSLLLLCLLAACAPTPDDGQIEAAIRASLTMEASPPALVFEDMEIPMCFAGKADAVLWTQDKAIQRNYSLEYDREARVFVVSGFTTATLGESGSYYFIPNDDSLAVTEYAQFFDFSADSNQTYMLLYAGQGDGLSELRVRFEEGTLTGLNTGRLAEFEEFDLGGDTLVLFVPRYKDLSVWICEAVYTHGNHIESGLELARSADKPVYIFCDFDDSWPAYEIHISFGGQERFFLTREDLLERLTPS